MQLLISLITLVILFGVAVSPIMGQDDTPSRIVAVAAAGPQMTSQVAPRFGQAAYFTVVDVKSEHAKSVVRLDPSHTGYELANELIKFKAEAVITGKIGPNALGVLRAAEVKVIQGVSGTVEEALSRFESGELE